MISNQILQETINGMKEVTGIDLCILDLSGRIVVTTMEITDALAQHAEEFADSMVFKILRFLMIRDWNIYFWLLE